MGCEQWREALSAQLDGEETVVGQAETDVHLSRCSDCRHWLDRAATVTRLARTSVVTHRPDLVETVLGALAPPGGLAGTAAGVPATAAVGFPAETAATATGVPSWRGRLTTLLRAALGLLGAVQLVLGLAQIGGGTSGAHTHAAGGLTATSGHLWHESAAWNVAIGAGFLFVAVRRSRPAGLLPTLSVFVAMLVLVSVNDLIAAMVEPARLVSHGFVLAGYLIIVALSRPALDPSRPPSDNRPERPAWQVRFSGADPQTPPKLRLVSSGPVSARVADAGVLALPARRLPGQRPAA
jgi:predicted anti-sigma-YlaC factor YlaD